MKSERGRSWQSCIDFGPLNNFSTAIKNLRSKKSILHIHPTLNDPMEGTRNIFWLGDQIVWGNLFRHYIYCLHLTYAASRFLGDAGKLQPQHIPIMSEIGKNWTPKETI